MLVRHGLVAGAAGAEIVAGDDAGILEQLDRAVDGGDRDLRIDGRGAAVELLDVGVIGRGLQHARDDAALLGHAHALGNADFLEASAVFASQRPFPDGGGQRIALSEVAPA